MNGKKQIIASASEMSNLVGMYAFMVFNDKITMRVYIKGKASNEYFIVQRISPLTGEPNIATLMTLQQLAEFKIAPNKNIANEILEDYSRHHIWRY